VLTGVTVDCRCVAPGRKLVFEIGDKRIDISVGLPECLDSLNAVTNRRVVATAIKAPDDCGTPAANMFGQVPSNLPIKASGLRVAQAARDSEARGNHCIDLCE
jgi:hypothetical protein